MVSKFAVLSSVSLVAMLIGATPACAAADPAPAAQDQAQAPATSAVEESAPEDVVVTGFRASLAKAADIKRNSLNVVDSIVADDIGKLPDRTVAAALQRVPGVQVTVGDNNEIVGPIVRGLPDILTTLDGREIFTGTGRGFAYQDLPAEALAGADVYKSTSAELIEGGVAGVINLRLHKPFDFKGFTLAANGRAIYTANTQEVNPVLGLLVSDRFDTGIGEIGILGDISYARNRFDRPVAFNCDFRSGTQGPPGAAGVIAPTCVGGVSQEGTYERKQGNLALQWKAAPGLEIYANGLYTEYVSRWASNFLIDDVFGGTSFSNVTKTSQCQDYNVGSDGFYQEPGKFRPDGTPIPSFRQNLCTASGFTSNNHGGFTSTQAHFDRTQVYIISGGAKWTSGALDLAADVSYQHSRVRNQNFILDIFKAGNGITTNVQTNVNGGTNFVDTANGLGDPANFALSPLNQDNIRDIGKEFAAKVDGTYRVGTILDNIQFGLRYADHSATHQQSLGGVNPDGVRGTLISNVSFLPADFLVHSSGIPSVNGNFGVIVPNQDQLRDPAIQDQLRKLYGLSAGWPEFTPDRAFAAGEKTYSGYLQAGYKIPFGGSIELDGQIGGRFTHTERTISGAAYVTPAPTTAVPNPAAVLTPFGAKTTDDNFLPNASARLKFGGGLQARFTYARAIARPSFGDLNPGLSYLISTNSLILPAGSGGNPNLRPQKSDSFDATLEYYFSRNGFIAIGGYYKDIKDRVISQSQVETINGFDYNITRPRNVGAVTLKGIEVSAQTFFDFLPGAWSGFGVFGNFTLADSKVNTVGDPLFGQSIQGVSKYNYNIGGLYDKNGLTGRVVYTYRSGYYDENYGGTNVRPVGQTLILNQVRPNGRLDASIGYEFQKGVTISIDGTNLTHAKYKSYYGDSALPRDTRFDDSSYSIGVAMRF
ncbi:TonB-dependent receptor [Sphingomonas immobilis]|uniref:TonB-dependent receptor n=1 Tax=Sphingomonas immobilis TaxID=3063997 RepID=A0ABT8ZT73_9SPHN|nr:TonB-dependent receptor [Sphingomonas sp. CA1-15]MDO7840765.1 TonB-dependent receptor [Sphingomonas sp. CA1-15]